MDPRYPIGKFLFDGEISSEVIKDWIGEIESLPGLVKAAVNNMNNDQLDMPYRPDGWTVRQVVHHLADSHMNAYIRFKLTLTEENPVIKPYNEVAWAELQDYKSPIENSIALLEALHQRWIILLSHLSSTDLKRTFIHPDSGKISLGENIGIYAWHGRHHLAHITSVLSKK